MDLGDLVVAEDEDAEAGGGLELAVGQVEAGEAGQGALVPAQARPASFTSFTLFWERLRWTRLWRPHSSLSGSRHRP